MCIMIQKATGIADEKLMKAQIRNSYSFRKLLQVLWVVAAFLTRASMFGRRHPPGLSQHSDLLPAV